MNDRIIINGHEYEVNSNTGELTPLCYWLSHDTCILENICCDGKGRCKLLYIYYDTDMKTVLQHDLERRCSNED